MSKNSRTFTKSVLRAVRNIKDAVGNTDGREPHHCSHRTRELANNIGSLKELETFLSWFQGEQLPDHFAQTEKSR